MSSAAARRNCGGREVHVPYTTCKPICKLSLFLFPTIHMRIRIQLGAVHSPSDMRVFALTLFALLCAAWTAVITRSKHEQIEFIRYFSRVVIDICVWSECVFNFVQFLRERKQKTSHPHTVHGTSHTRTRITSTANITLTMIINLSILMWKTTKKNCWWLQRVSLQRWSCIKHCLLYAIVSHYTSIGGHKWM